MNSVDGKILKATHLKRAIVTAVMCAYSHYMRAEKQTRSHDSVK